MSYVGLNPAQLGVLIPQDPATGLLRPEEALVFDLLNSVSYQTQGSVARHPVQSGREGPSDAILEEPERVSLSATFVDKPFHVSGFPGAVPYSQPDRCLEQAQALRTLKSRRRLVTAVLPGRVLSDRAVATLEVTPDPATMSVSVSLTLDHVRVVGLNLIPVVADADSKALGEQVVEIGY